MGLVYAGGHGESTFAAAAETAEFGGSCGAASVAAAQRSILEC